MFFESIFNCFYFIFIFSPIYLLSPKGEYVNFASSIIILLSGGSISYSLVLSSVVMITFSILSKRLLLKREGLSNARVISVLKKMLLQHSFVKIHRVLKSNIWWMIKFDLMKPTFVCNFQKERVCWSFSVQPIKLCNINKRSV